jgi:hypothetical protein
MPARLIKVRCGCDDLLEEYYDPGQGIHRGGRTLAGLLSKGEGKAVATLDAACSPANAPLTGLDSRGGQCGTAGAVRLVIHQPRRGFRGSEQAFTARLVGTGRGEEELPRLFHSGRIWATGEAGLGLLEETIDVGRARCLACGYRAAESCKGGRLPERGSATGGQQDDRQRHCLDEKTTPHPSP